MAYGTDRFSWIDEQQQKRRNESKHPLQRLSSNTFFVSYTGIVQTLVERKADSVSLVRRDCRHDLIHPW